MPGFADSFWSGDYAGGLGVLFGKLQQGVVENQQILNIAKLRADAEELYGQKLTLIPAGNERPGGFSKDEGASVRKAYDGMNKEMEEAGKNHRKVADGIRQLVIAPFSKWCEAHEERIISSHDDLQARIKAHDKQAELVKKLRSQYFNKCRLVEDLEEETKFIQVPAPETPISTTTTPQIKLPENADPEDEEALEIGDLFYQPAEVKKILKQMLETIPLGEAKVAILGTYQNVSTGEQIVSYIQKNLNATSISHAERIGQDLVSYGFLRLVGTVGNTFANSSKLNYQWRAKAFQLAGLPEKPVKKVENALQDQSADAVVESPTMSSVGDYLGNLLGSQRPNETPAEKLRREANEADERYKANVRKLDSMRCSLEESMMDHLKFMERCELDRLKAIKSVILDFSGAISNVIPTIQSTVDNLLLYQETVQPFGDLRYMLESYRTGSFVPKVITYDNYYNAADEQTFGVDLEVRARGDRKRVPIIVTTILTYLDHHYPDLDGDEARRGIWLVDVPLSATHHLRMAVNNAKTIPKEVLAKYEIPIVASVLKLYLLELPDSLVSSHKYEIIKTVYTTHGGEGEDKARLAVIQNTLGSLPLSNIATLDAITTHFTRLIELTSADETFISSLAYSLANCILRPRVESSLTQHERHAYRLVRDLFAHKDQIFGELKRASTLNSGRARAISTDESQRRAHVEARNRAVIGAARSRPSSPAPNSRHRREISTDGGNRFPIQTSPTSGSPRTGRYRPQSLEVPGEESLDRNQRLDNDVEPPQMTNEPDGLDNDTPISSNAPDESTAASTPTSTATFTSTAGLEKSNSLGRSRWVKGKNGTGRSNRGFSTTDASAINPQLRASNVEDSEKRKSVEVHGKVSLEDGDGACYD
ncbi:Rho-GTPase-activating protein 8 [Rhizina undulata]